MKNLVECNRTDASQAWLFWLADILRWVTLSWAHFCPTTSISGCQLKDYIRVFTATRWAGIFQPSPCFWGMVGSPVLHQILGCSATVSCHFGADVAPWWLEAWVIDSANSLVGFVYVFADSCLLTCLGSYFISCIWIAQLLFARGFFSVVNYRIIIAN